MRTDTFKMQIHGQNELNRVSQIMAKQYTAQLPEFLNKKIGTNDGFTKKFTEKVIKPDVKPVPFENGFASLHWGHLEIKWGNLYLMVSVGLHGGKYEDRTYYCQYFEKRIQLGVMDEKDNNILIKVCDVDVDNDFRQVDYQETLKKILKVKELLAEAEKVKSGIKIPSEWYKYM